MRIIIFLNLILLSSYVLADTQSQMILKKCEDVGYLKTKKSLQAYYEKQNLKKILSQDSLDSILIQAYFPYLLKDEQMLQDWNALCWSSLKDYELFQDEKDYQIWSQCVSHSLKKEASQWKPLILNCPKIK